MPGQRAAERIEHSYPEAAAAGLLDVGEIGRQACGEAGCSSWAKSLRETVSKCGQWGVLYKLAPADHS
jgi:hypothetical protein